MKKILLVLDYEEMFKGGLPTTQTLNIKLLKDLFKKEGFIVKIINYNELINKSKSKFLDYYVVYTSSQLISYKMYVDDVLDYLSNDNILIPKYEIFKAHENKGYQEILKIQLGIESNNGKIYGSEDDLKKDAPKMKYPVILKTINGAGSKGVRKADSIEELMDIYDKISFSHMSDYYNFKRKLKRKYNIRYNKSWYDRQRRNNYIVIQNFIKGLDGDWKILIFGEKYFCLNRGIKEGDFRASGSGILNFEKLPSDNILDFAKTIYNKLDVPVLSLDIAVDAENVCHLIEFQGLHFGPLTLIDSAGYYVKRNKKWNRKVGKSILEEEYVKAYSDYIRKR